MPVEAPVLRLGLSAIAEGFRAGTLAPEALTDALLAAIAADTRAIHAFCLVDAEAARAQARSAGARWRAGRPRGPLDGVPVSVKDLVHVAGWPTRRGSLASVGEPPAVRDAPSVALLRAAGCVVFGKTTTTEFGADIGSANPHTGATRNPVDPSRSAGGSSSGAAAQIAAGWGPLALASDAGGSVRIPASYGGVVGFKPSFGAIPLAPPSAFAEWAHLGPLARSVDDIVAAMAVLSQPAACDPASLFPRDGAALGLPHRAPLRIGWALQLGAEMAVAPAITAALQALVEHLASAGHAIVPLPTAAAGTDCAAPMWALWAARIHESFVDWPAARRQQLGAGLQARYAEAERLDAETLARSRAHLRGFCTQLATAFDGIDLLLTPTTPTVAPPLAPVADRMDNWFASNGFCYPFNLTQQPALSLPFGRDAQGLPFGLQIVGRRYHDAQLLGFGRQVEALLSSAGSVD